MIEPAPFLVLAATAGAAFGLLAVWAALGRVHWSVRFVLVAAVIGCLFPVPAFDLASLVSGYKSNRLNWLGLGASGFGELRASRA